MPQRPEKKCHHQQAAGNQETRHLFSSCPDFRVGRAVISSLRRSPFLLKRRSDL
jgi:hypothetical protein